MVFNENNRLIIQQEIDYLIASNSKVQIYDYDTNIETIIKDNKKTEIYTITKRYITITITLNFFIHENKSLQFRGYDIESESKITSKIRILNKLSIYLINIYLLTELITYLINT